MHILSRLHPGTYSHNAGVPIHSHNTPAVVSYSSDSPGDMCTMPLIILGVASVSYRIKAMTSCRAIDFNSTDRHVESSRRCPDVGSQIGMRIVYARVDDGNHIRF